MADGDRVVQKVFGKGKVGIIRTVALDDIVVGDIDIKVLYQVGFALDADGRRKRECAVLQQNGHPVEDTVFAQIEHLQTGGVDLVLIDISIKPLELGRPFTSQIAVRCAVKTLTVIVVAFALAERRMLYH